MTRTVRASMAGACLAVLVLMAGCDRPPIREVVLIARGMTFVLADQPDVVNPPIQLRAGERVRLVLKNEAPGLIHDLEIGAWGVQIESIRSGETANVVFDVPDFVGRTDYRCRPHAELMHGVVDVSR